MFTHSTARCGFQGLPARGTSARAARHHRIGLEPHFGSAPWFQRARRSPPTAGGEVTTSGTARPTVTGRRGSFSRTWRLQLDVDPWRGLLLAPVLFAPTGLELRQSRGASRDDRAVDFWLELGVDGLRLDAVPYLYEEEGTNCENLPKTHAFLKWLARTWTRSMGTECCLGKRTMAGGRGVVFRSGPGLRMPHGVSFPAHARLFMAVRMEDRTPIVDILEQTPPIPPPANGRSS